MSGRMKTLGKGLEALLPGGDADIAGSSSAGGILLSCDVERIAPNPYQPRKEMDPSALRQLSESIKEKGIIQPLLVRKVEGGGYELIAGERRWQAAKMAGLEKVPVIVKSDISQADRLELAIIENIQRQNLNAMEEAEAYDRLMREFGHTQEEVAQKVGKERSTVANTLRLLQLPDFAKVDLMAGVISAGHARVILSAPDEKSMRLVRDEIVGKGLSVRQSEGLVKRLKQEAARGGRKGGTGAAAEKYEDSVIPGSYCQALVGEMERKLGCKVRIVQNGSRGKIEVEYYSLDDLERLVSLIARSTN